MDIVMFGYFRLPLEGSLLLLAISAFIFIFSMQLLGTMAAVIIKDIPKALGALAMMLAPAFGYLATIFPRDSMNEFAHAWSAVVPGMWYCMARIDQTLRGAPLDVSLHTIANLILLGSVFGIITLVALIALRRKNDRRSANQKRMREEWRQTVAHTA